MRLPRFLGFVDLAVLTVIFVAIILPARVMHASAAMKGADAEHFALALAEARMVARPDDPVALADFSRRLSRAGFIDWAIENAVEGLPRTEKSPEAWRSLLAVSVAHVDRLDVRPALDYANKALAACSAAGASCASWELIRMKLYQEHLDAGIASGIDPRQDPKGFQRAGQSNLRMIRLGDPAK